jgi:hypothetical protein
MLVTHPRSFTFGVVLAVTFFAALGVMFMPLFGGQNAFRAADQFFNSIAKHSSYYIPSLRQSIDRHRGTQIDLKIPLPSAEAAARAAALLQADGATVTASGSELVIKGDFAAVLEAALADSDAAFKNDGKSVRSAEGAGPQEVLATWWEVLKGAQKRLREKKKFVEAAAIEEVNSKAVEVGYNFYGIRPEPASRNAAMLALALLFYLVYTVWWGYAILLLFEGLGLETKASGRHEA